MYRKQNTYYFNNNFHKKYFELFEDEDRVVYLYFFQGTLQNKVRNIQGIPCF